MTWREKTLTGRGNSKGLGASSGTKATPFYLGGNEPPLLTFLKCHKAEFFFFVFINTVPGLAFSMPTDSGTLRGNVKSFLREKPWAKVKHIDHSAVSLSKVSGSEF